MSNWLLKLVGGLILLTAILLAVSRAPDLPPSALVARWAAPPSDFIDVGGQIVHLRDEGPRQDEEPIVLLHGTGASLHTWEGWVQVLRKSRRVITLDLRGFGLTGPAADGDYRVQSDVALVIALLERLKLPRVVLGGNSLGGEIAWRTALAAPDRVSRLLLVDSAGYAFLPQEIPLGFRLASLPVVRHLAQSILPRAITAASLRSVYGNPDRVTPALVDRYFQLTLREGNRGALIDRLAQHRWGADAERIRDIRQPTLILWGRLDRLIPLDSAERFARDIPGSTLTILDGLGHVPQEEDPLRSLEPVLGFLGLAPGG